MKNVLAFPLIRLALIVVPFIAAFAGIVTAGGGHHSLRSGIFVTAIAVLVLVALIIFVERFTTGRSPAEIGFDPARIVPDTAKGLALGAALFSAVVLELALSGHYRVVAVHFTWALVASALFFALGAALEELLFRGVLFRLIEEWTGTWIALAISAALFGAAHALNPGATWASSLAIALEAGVLLGAAFVVTRNVWFPIALHFAWNFLEGPIYGTQVSGRASGSDLLVSHISGPSWLTGGKFGPEAGAAAIVTCLIAAVALLVHATRNSLIRKGRSGAQTVSKASA
ncbi:MAG: type II CAAX endopeptidase family protein [Candidatus Cybelea sp.]